MLATVLAHTYVPSNANDEDSPLVTLRSVAEELHEQLRRLIRVARESGGMRNVEEANRQFARMGRELSQSC